MSNNAVETTTRERLGRVEAAAFITRHYFPCSKASLDKHASNGTGPRYTAIGPRAGGAAYYLPEDLRTWCEAQFAEPASQKKKAWAQRAR